MGAAALRTRQVVTAIVLLGALAATGRPQQQQHGNSGSSNQFPTVPSTASTNSGIPDKDSATPPNMVERQTKMRSEERQKRLVADTDRLLELVTQLHADVAKTDKNILSLDVIRRSDEIEKLAHGIKERMKS